MTYTYKTKGTCSSNIELEVEDGIVKDIAFWGGCNGNLQGLSRLAARISCVKHCTKWDIRLLWLKNVSRGEKNHLVR